MAREFFPDTVAIETVLGCNARCVMCPVNDWKRPHGIMPDEVFNTAISQVSDFKDRVTSVSLFLDGEPLLDPHIAERVYACKSSGLKNVGITTNGFLLSKQRAVSLLDASIDWIVISFDSLVDDVYEAIRVRLKKDRVLDNILQLVAERDRRNSDTTIVVRFIEQDLNRGEFDDYFSFFSRRLDPVKDEIHFGKEHNWASSEDAGAPKGISPCGLIDSRVAIMRDGTVPICCVDYNAVADMGNIMNDHLLDIYNGDKWQTVRELHKSGNRSQFRPCDVCDVPELNEGGELSKKLKPTGKVLWNDAFTAFDQSEVLGSDSSRDVAS